MKRVPYTGTGTSRSRNGSAPRWSSWPWVRKTAPTRSRRSRSQERSGAMTSTPMGSFGNMIPQSTTAMRPSHSTAMQFMPISPRPPSGTMRTGAATDANLPPRGAAAARAAHRGAPRRERMR